MAPHPGIDTELFKETARKQLLDLLEGVRGKKNLVIEKSVAGPTGLFVKFSTLQQYGVDKVFFLESNNVDSSQKNVVFLIRGEHIDRAISVTEQVKRLQQESQIEHEFSVFLIPRRNLVCNKIFEDAGILGDIVVEEFPLYFLPLDSDVLSLELEDSFGDLFLRKDPTCVFLAAKALMLIQQKHGLFPRILGKGDNAHRLMELLLRMRSEASADETGSSSLGMMPSMSIESLIIIDREVDLGTVLLSQLTYEGLIDELFGIKDNQIEARTSVVGPAPGSSQQQNASAQQQQPQQPQQPQQGLTRKILLDSSDKLFAQLRDANFAVVASLLNRMARRLESDYESRHTAKSTSELREFVSKLPGYQAEQQGLKVHSGLVEEIMKHTNSDRFRRLLEVQQNLASCADSTAEHEAIEELIAQEAPLPDVLRLLCLESCVAGGLRPKDLEHFRTLVLHAYGYQHLLTLDALEKMQLLVPRSSANMFALPGGASSSTGSAARTNYAYLRRALRLIVNEVNETEPNDTAYVYSGYAPLSVRLVQCVLQKPYLLALTKAGAQPGSAAAAASSGAGGTGANGISAAVHGWQGFEDALKAAKGPTFNKVQKGPEAATKARSILSGTGGRKTVVVMFVGGITKTEVAALRFLGKSDPNRRILICTTSMISGVRMMDAAIEKGTFGPEKE